MQIVRFYAASEPLRAATACLLCLWLGACSGGGSDGVGGIPSDDPSGADAAPGLIGDGSGLEVDLVPEPVAGLRGVAYTDREIELFWQRSAFDSPIVGYRIERDGVQLELRDGLSYYDDAVEPGSTYRYAIRAVTADGRVGRAAEIVLVTEPAGPEITLEGSEPLVDYLFRLLAREPLADFRRIADEVYRARGDTQDAAAHGLLETARRFDPDVEAFVTEYGCQEGGEFEFQSYSTSTGGGIGRFTGCALPAFAEGHVIDGDFDWQLTIVKFVYNPGGDVDIGFDDMSLGAGAQGARRLTGSWSRGSGSASSAEVWSGSEYLQSAFEGQTRWTIERLSVFEGTVRGANPEPWRRRLEAAFRIQSPATGNRPLEVRISEPFEQEAENACYVRGRLEVDAVDGTRLVAVADNGDPASFRLEVHQGGEAVARDVPWSAVAWPGALLVPRVPNDDVRPIASAQVANPACP